MWVMFYYNSAAFVINDESVSFPPTSFDQDISNWDVSNVTNFGVYGGSNPSGLSSHSSDLFKNSDPLYFTSDTEIVETVHTFIHNGSGNNYTTHSITFNEPTECDVLIVGGGGAGGSDTGGGGGGGQVLYYTNDNVSFKTGNSIILNGTYDINVGNGGSPGADGYNTVISHNSSDIHIAGGGGGGGTAHTSNALSSPLGGGGGGNSGNSANKNGAISTGGGGQGGISGPSRGGGGGGGANIGSSSNGGNVNGNVTGSGGTGVDINITGESFGVGGGGSGGSYLSSSVSSGSVSHGGGQGGIGRIPPQFRVPTIQVVAEVVQDIVVRV